MTCSLLIFVKSEGSSPGGDKAALGSNYKALGFQGQLGCDTCSMCSSTKAASSPSFSSVLSRTSCFDRIESFGAPGRAQSKGYMHPGRPAHAPLLPHANALSPW